MTIAASSPRRVGLAALALVLLALHLLAPAAPAKQFPPSPQGEDIAFLQLGSVGELVSLELFRAGGSSAVLTPPERATMRRLARQRAKAWERLGAPLGEDAITAADFGVRIPASVLRSRPGTLALAARFERLLAGLYLSGVQSAIDPPTRLLIGRHLATSSRNLALIRGLRGPRTNLAAPKPLSVQYVGIQFDRYLTIPGS